MIGECASLVEAVANRSPEAEGNQQLEAQFLFRILGRSGDAQELHLSIPTEESQETGRETGRVMYRYARVLFASALLVHLAHGFVGLVPGVQTIAKDAAPPRSRTIKTRRRCRPIASMMSSTAPPQNERQQKMPVGDFDSWFWGGAHVQGGVEHAVFQGTDSAVVLFDGECNFCNSGVWMMISNSNARSMRFCAQNTEIGHSLLASFGQNPERLSSIAVLDKSGCLHTRSAAVVEILSRMKMPCPALGVLLKAIPEPVRDSMYAWVSRNRHAFGTESQMCRIPEDDEVSRFLL